MIKTQNEVVDSIEVASFISTQRSYCDLIMSVKTIFPKYFGFEGAGILLYDKQKDTLFCIEQSFTDEQLQEIESIRQKKNRGELLTEEEQMKDFERQLKAGDKRSYPTTLGVTGEAFRTGKVIYADKIKTLGSFLSSVDNLALDIKDVRSIMVIPVFPHH